MELINCFPHITYEGNYYFPAVICANMIGWRNGYSILHTTFETCDYHTEKRINYICEADLYYLIMLSRNPIMKRLGIYLACQTIEPKRDCTINFEEVREYLKRDLKK